MWYYIVLQAQVFVSSLKLKKYFADIFRNFIFWQILDTQDGLEKNSTVCQIFKQSYLQNMGFQLLVQALHLFQQVSNPETASVLNMQLLSCKNIAVPSGQSAGDKTYLPVFQFGSGDNLEIPCKKKKKKIHKAWTAYDNFYIYSVFCMHNLALCNAAFTKWRGL